MMKEAHVRKAKVRVPVVRGDLDGIDAVESESFIVLVFSDVRPLKGPAAFLDWRCCGALSQALLSGAFRGDRGEIMLLPMDGRLGRRRMFVFGLGSINDDGAIAAFEGLVRQAVGVAQAAGVRRVCVAAPQGIDSAVEKKFLQAASEAFAAHQGLIESVLVDDPEAV